MSDNGIDAINAIISMTTTTHSLKRKIKSMERKRAAKLNSNSLVKESMLTNRPIKLSKNTQLCVLECCDSDCDEYDIEIVEDCDHEGWIYDKVDMCIECGNFYCMNHLKKYGDDGYCLECRKKIMSFMPTIKK